MSGGKQYKPVGGVVAAELFAVRGLASPAQMTAGTGTAVELCDAGCSYSETFTVDEGRVSVEHVLVLRADMKRAEAWFDDAFVARCGDEGVAALVTLASGETLVAGWSPRFGFEQALRLRSLHPCASARIPHRAEHRNAFSCMQQATGRLSPLRE